MSQLGQKFPHSLYRLALGACHVVLHPHLFTAHSRNALLNVIANLV